MKFFFIWKLPPLLLFAWYIFLHPLGTLHLLHMYVAPARNTLVPITTMQHMSAINYNSWKQWAPQENKASKARGDGREAGRLREKGTGPLVPWLLGMGSVYLRISREIASKAGTATLISSFRQILQRRERALQHAHVICIVYWYQHSVTLKYRNLNLFSSLYLSNF